MHGVRGVALCILKERFRVRGLQHSAGKRPLWLLSRGERSHLRVAGVGGAAALLAAMPAAAAAASRPAAIVPTMEAATSTMGKHRRAAVYPASVACAQ